MQPIILEIEKSQWVKGLVFRYFIEKHAIQKSFIPTGRNFSYMLIKFVAFLSRQAKHYKNHSLISWKNMIAEKN